METNKRLYTPKHSLGASKTPKSNNYKKFTIKIAKLHKKIADIRKDTLHKFTTYLTDNFRYISIEDLN
ncbi:MAG: transposase, partial [Sulfurovaceae bacterium]|nr:transposase [Sulfurovaceae bacterium]